MQPIGTELAKLATELLRGASPEEVPLLAWPIVCGKAVAAHTRAVSFTCGVLRVEVTEAAWRDELAAMEPRILAALRHLAPAGTVGAEVQHVEFVLASPEREVK